ncbi:MAG TPA: nuclear transport factor 2 family protein [Acidimicrobiales bacterium]|nr:nuclear transport factor 2 family protein [Acidimicrobiales bacterium]
MTNNTDTITDPKIDAVRRLYEAYGRGDVGGALADLADDVDWAAEASGTSVPWWGPFRGRSEVPRFFEAIGSSVDVTEFTPVSFTANDTDVVAVVHWSYTVRSTGKRASMYMQHWWRFAGGRIVFFRGSEDTEQSARAFS